MSRYRWKSVTRLPPLATVMALFLCFVLTVFSVPCTATAEGLEQVVLDLPDTWETTANTGLAERTWKHEEHDITVQVFVLTAGEDEVVKDAEGNEVEVTGSYIVRDWDEQFVDGGPLVVVNDHAEQTRGGVEGVLGDLTWNNRRGLYFGFSSADIAAAHGTPLERDRHAFFVLCEGSTLGNADVAEVCADVFNGLKVLP